MALCHDQGLGLSVCSLGCKLQVSSIMILGAESCRQENAVPSEMNDSSTLFCARRGHAGNFEFDELSVFQTDDMG